MELPETASLRLSDEQLLEARLANAIEQPDIRMEKGNIVWSPEAFPGLTVQADGQKSEYDDKAHYDVLSAQLLVDPNKAEVGHYKVVVGPDGLLLTQPGNGMQEVVTDTERRKALIGVIATKLQAAIESASQPDRQAKIMPFVKPIVRNSVELTEAA